MSRKTLKFVNADHIVLLAELELLLKQLTTEPELAKPRVTKAELELLGLANAKASVTLIISFRQGSCSFWRRSATLCYCVK